TSGLSADGEDSHVSLSAWLRIGWLVFAADVVYWFWLMGQPEPGPGWWGRLNIVLYFGGALLFVVLIIIGLIVWRATEREQTLSYRPQGSFRSTGPCERRFPRATQRRRVARVKWLALVAAVCAVLVGCGGSGGGSTVVVRLTNPPLTHLYIQVR